MPSTSDSAVNSAEKKGDGLTEKSPHELTTKAGKLIVSVIEDLKKEPNKALTNLQPIQLTSQPSTPKSIEMHTKKGSIIVHTTSKDNKLEHIVLEQITKKNEKAAKSTLTIDAGTATPTAIVKLQKRERVDFSRSSLERNFITPARAISDFLLKMSDLESLPKTKRRSPYEQEPPIIVYWRKDVEAKAIEVWGSRENLLRECLKREIERKQHQQSKYKKKPSNRCEADYYEKNCIYSRYFHGKTTTQRLSS